MKKETSKRRLSSLAESSRPSKNGKSSIIASASTSHKSVGPKLQLCVYCADLKIGNLPIDSLENTDISNCICCELIRSAIPTNDLLEITEVTEVTEVTNKFWPGASLSLTNMTYGLEIRDLERRRN